MKVIINGKETEVPDSIAVGRMLELRGVRPGEAVVQYNGDILDKTSWAEIVLKENDELEILRFVGGG